MVRSKGRPGRTGCLCCSGGPLKMPFSLHRLNDVPDPEDDDGYEPRVHEVKSYQLTSCLFLFFRLYVKYFIKS